MYVYRGVKSEEKRASPDTNSIIDIDDCLILSKKMTKIQTLENERLIALE